jgi:prenyltransferase beta subunit
MNNLFLRVLCGLKNRFRRKYVGYKIGQRLKNQNNIQGHNFNELRKKTLEFVESRRIPGHQLGRYGFSSSQMHPLLYNSVFAALTRYLFNDLKSMRDSEKAKWGQYINSYQCDDGLFRDSLIDNDIAETCEWWGWRHMTLHVTIALSVLDCIATKPFKFLEPYLDPDYLISWLESRNWKSEPANVSNEVQNIGTLLQYARDFHYDDKAGRSVLCLLDWLDEKQNPQNGSWGYFKKNRWGLSYSVQTGYHLWCLYFYDQRPINHIESIVDCCLQTQNEYGGFGVPLNSSACEDIDSIDPLVRISFITDYRREDILSALKRALNWVLFNGNSDGSFVFRRMEPFNFGHEKMFSRSDEGSMFYTWFRTLSLAYISKVLPEYGLGDIEWKFVRTPGHQFWIQDGNG